MPAIQDVIHRLEEGGGLRYLKIALLALALFGMAVSYNLRGFRNMSNPEAMDAAQLARNISEGKGYTTLFLRPLSLYLVQKANNEKLGPAPVGDLSDRGEIRGMHPDISNPPLYPLLLAGLMKVTHCDYQKTTETKSLWNRSGGFWMYPPDFVISLFNQIFFVLSVILVFILARVLFDSQVAWTSAGIFLATDLMWRFSISGISTMLLLFIFLLLTSSLIVLEKVIRENPAPGGRIFVFAALAGLCLGLGALTRYSFIWMTIPAAIFVGFHGGKHRILLCLTMIAAFAVLLAPWIIRNYKISHTPFGTAGYAVYETTASFGEFRLMRSLKPNLNEVHVNQIWYKFTGNLTGILHDDLPKLGGNWVIAFFFVGLMIGFRNPALGRLRWFILASFPVLMMAQALGRTALSDEAPVVNTENLLVILFPLLLIFGVSLFFTLLDQLNLPFGGLRYIIIGAFCVICCLPMLLAVISARLPAIAYPPYFPPVIQKVSNWMEPDELMMSDIPWAVAWYGKRQCIWLTLNAQEDFFSIYDYQKRIAAVYLTPETMDSRFLSQWVRASEHSWGSFILESMLRKELPPYFPLRKAPVGFLPEQLFLTDRERWSNTAPPTPVSPTATPEQKK